MDFFSRSTALNFQWFNMRTQIMSGALCRRASRTHATDSTGSRFSSTNVGPDSSSSIGKTVQIVSITSVDMDIESFRRIAFIPEFPILIRQGAKNIPAMRKWFRKEDTTVAFSPYFSQFGETVFPYEFVLGGAMKKRLPAFKGWLKSKRTDKYNTTKIITGICDQLQASDAGFQRFYGPFDLLIKAAEFNKSKKSTEKPIEQLYIAQSQLNDLPEPLKDDVPVPDIVQYAGKGDVYDSSLWLGLQPTYTPLHRDPNPNLFLQILNSKTVRLLPPTKGQGLYTWLRQSVGGGGNSRFRGEEMMGGAERIALYEAIWGINAPEQVYQAILSPGDSLFIPKGWWHSVLGRDVIAPDSLSGNPGNGSLNASVNWWFR